MSDLAPWQMIQMAVAEVDPRHESIFPPKHPEGACAFSAAIDKRHIRKARLLMRLKTAGPEAQTICSSHDADPRRWPDCRKVSVIDALLERRTCDSRGAA